MTSRIRTMPLDAARRRGLPDDGSPAPERIAIVGTGPRGLSVIERLASRLAGRRTLRPLVVHAIDDVEVGCGRIWRTDQPDWLIMNTRCRNATMFPGASGEPQGFPPHRPTFMEWWRQIDGSFPGPSGFAPRGLYGKYLKFVLDLIELNLPDQMRLHRVLDRVVGVTERAGEYVLDFESGRAALHVDRLVVCTGYPHAGKEKPAARNTGSATRHVSAFEVLETFQSGLSLPPDLSGRVVGVRGLGLSFYDVLSELTIGRGGRYVFRDGKAHYVPSGREPARIVAGSRSGCPLPVRGRDDRPANLAFVPRFFTASRVAEIRAEGPACFRSRHLPWITAEVNLVFIEKTLGPDRYREFRDALDAADVTSRTVLQVMSELARPHGVTALLDIEACAAPFAGRSFASQQDFRRAVVALVREDVARAEAGEFTDPVKAAHDVLRHIRPIIRQAVDLGGLTRASHHEFITSIARSIAFLSTGPSLMRAKQLLALVECGLLEILGPSVSFRQEGGPYVVASSERVEGFKVEVDVLIDAHVAAPDVDTDGNPAIRSLADKGTFRNFMGAGGVEVTPKPFHPITTDGEVKDRIHVLGIPTESARWFLHVGLIEPGVWDEFIDDADAIAAASIRSLVPAEPETAPADGFAPPPGDAVAVRYLS